MRYAQVGTTTPLYLIEKEITPPTSIIKDGVINQSNFFLFDRSGSMYGVLARLIEQLKLKIRELPEGDTVTIGWFSGEGQYRFVVKGHRLSTVKDWEAIDKILDGLNQTVGLTCFSEILEDLKSVVDEVEALNPLPNALTFFTDGYPVVRDHFKENESIRKAIAVVSPKVASTLLVGYGDYYNKTLMASMADQFGGSLIHSDNLMDFSQRLKSFWMDARENGERIKVSIDQPGDLAFSLNGNQVVYYDTSKGEILFTPARKGKSYLYFLTSKAPKDGKQLSLTDAKVKSSDALVKGVYALAYMLTQATKTDVALEVLSSLGEKALIDKVTNSYTNAEYGAAEASILECITAPSKRFQAGRDTAYLPPVDAFCLKDAIDMLIADEEAFFHVSDERFEYRRIGKKSVQKNGFPKFTYDPASKSALNNLTYNDTRLNLSLRAKIEGTIPLDGEASRLGFNETFRTYIYRNYAIVKDGILNVRVLPISMSKASFDKLQEVGCIAKHIAWKPEGVYSVDLSAMPIMNRKIAEGKTSANWLAHKVLQEAKLEGDLKVLRYWKGLSDRGFTSGGPLLPAQVDYLKKFGVTSNGFNPPSTDEPATDFYEAREFAIKLKGMQKLPKVEDVIKKMEENKKLTNVELLLEPMIYSCKSQEKQLKGKVVSWLDYTIKTKTQELRELREQIQGTKFAVLLGKKWFDEFTSRDEASLTIQDSLFGPVTVEFALSTKKVEF